MSLLKSHLGNITVVYIHVYIPTKPNLTSSPKGNDRSPESNVPRSHVVFSKGSDQKQPRKCWGIIFPIISQWGLSVAMKTRVLIQSAPKLYAALPPPPMTLQIKFDQEWPTGFRDIQVQKCEIFVTQGQVTPKSVVWFGPKSNSTEFLCLSWLTAILMMIRSKMNELAWRHHFPIISLWEIF